MGDVIRSERGRVIGRAHNPHHISHRLRSGNESRVITDLFSTVRTEFGPRNLNPTVAKRRDRGVLFCAGGETGRAYPQDSQGFATLSAASGVSLPTSRTTRPIHTLGPPTPHFWPKLSAVSLSRAAWVNEGLASLNRSQPTGVGFGELKRPKSK